MKKERGKRKEGKIGGKKGRKGEEKKEEEYFIASLPYLHWVRKKKQSFK